jgi:hypothetical protein
MDIERCWHYSRPTPIRMAKIFRDYQGVALTPGRLLEGEASICARVGLLLLDI